MLSGCLTTLLTTSRDAQNQDGFMSGFLFLRTPRMRGSYRREPNHDKAV
jgi:hypothetical protein